MRVRTGKGKGADGGGGEGAHGKGLSLDMCVSVCVIWIFHVFMLDFVYFEAAEIYGLHAEITTFLSYISLWNRRMGDGEGEGGGFHISDARNKQLSTIRQEASKTIPN